MVPRLRHGAAAARRVGGVRLAAAQRGLQPARRQEVPRGCAIYHGQLFMLTAWRNVTDLLQTSNI